MPKSPTYWSQEWNPLYMNGTFPFTHLAPLSDLCVVVVTRSAWSKGEGMAPAATRPLMWAMSDSR